MTTTPAAPPRRASGRLALVLGLGLVILGVLGYVVQLSMRRLWMPWYMPIAATLGVVLLLFSLRQRRSVWRILALLLVILIAGFEWTVLLAARLPAYAGPVASGQPFPAFATLQVDGSPFTQRDLEGGQNNVLIFFRGRW